MNEPRQAYMKLLGEEGCYFLCLVHLAETVSKERIDAIPFFLEALEKNYIRMDCTVLDPARVMHLLTGVVWVKSHQPANYQIKAGEMEVLRYERKTGSGTTVHFVVGDGLGEIEYDPMGDSRTVREGSLVSKRIFSRA
jgi:hypothetical protein